MLDWNTALTQAGWWWVPGTLSWRLPDSAIHACVDPESQSCTFAVHWHDEKTARVHFVGPGINNPSELETYTLKAIELQKECERMGAQ